MPFPLAQRTAGGIQAAQRRRHRPGDLAAVGARSRHRHATPARRTRNVDDQAEWLDDEHVLYALPGGDGRTAIMDEWLTPADGGGEPRLFLPEAYSAGVDRPGSRS